MKASFRCFASGALWYMGALIVLCAVGSSPLHAQFQSVFGGAGHDGAIGGVVPTNDGGFIAVGHSSSFGTSMDVYVVKSNRCGRLVWSRTYDLGGSDIGRKIRQTVGGYIIVGSTQQNNCSPNNDAFLLKIDADGNVNWGRTYGGVKEEEGMDVILPPTVAATPHYLVVGYSATAGDGDSDGWIFRTDANGVQLWSRVYGGPAADVFTSAGIDCAGNAIAAGTTTSFTANGDEDILVVTANALTGALGSASRYGSPLDDGAWGVLSNGNEFYVAGYTQRPGSGTEAYVMRARCGSGAVLNDAAFGGAGTQGDDQFTEIKLLPTGNLILTGFLQNEPNGFGGYDVHTLELDAALGLVRSRIYGGSRDDQGWSIAPVVDPAAPDPPPYTLIQAGYTFSFGAGGSDLYEIYSTSTGESFCNQDRPGLQDNIPGYTAIAFPSGDPNFFAGCNASPIVQEHTRFENLCSPCDAPLNQRPGENLSNQAPAIERGRPGTVTVQVRFSNSSGRTGSNARK